MNPESCGKYLCFEVLFLSYHKSSYKYNLFVELINTLPYNHRWSDFLDSRLKDEQTDEMKLFYSHISGNIIIIPFSYTLVTESFTSKN